MASLALPEIERFDLQGAQQPRVRFVPEYVSSSGHEAIELAAMAGLELDEWEKLILVDALGERENGKWAAFEVATVVPRQNGKGTILEARELAGLFLLGENLLIHSAHEQATSSEHFRRLLNLIEGVPEFTRRMKKPSRGKGAEAIELHGGQRILFKTRTGGGGRGLTGDFVALDEAMILPVATTAALVPTMAARSVTGNPQMWYAGSAVDQEKHEHGVVLARVRERARKDARKLAYFEFSAEGDDPENLSADVLRDPNAWAQANPGLGIRISVEHVENECNGALGAREFAVERLGIGDWPATDGNGGRKITREAWDALIDRDSRTTGPVCFAFDVTPDQSAASIGVVGARSDGMAHLEVVEHRRGTGWVMDRLVELLAAHTSVGVVCDASGPAGALLPALANLKVEVKMVNAREHAQACGMLFDSVEQRGLRHGGQPELSAAISGAVTRSLGDAWAWARTSSKIDISPLVTCTLAFWGFRTLAPKRRSKVPVSL